MEIFETSRLLLRPRTPEDFDACLVMDRDPEVIRYVGAPWSNSDEHVAFLRRRLAERFPTGLGYWAIAPREEPAAFLGWVMLCPCTVAGAERSEEHTSELQSLMRSSYAVFCLNKKKDI